MIWVTQLFSNVDFVVNVFGKDINILALIALLVITKIVGFIIVSLVLIIAP